MGEPTEMPRVLPSGAEMARGSAQEPSVAFCNPGGVWILQPGHILHPQELERARGKASASAEPERALGCPHGRGTVTPQGQREGGREGGSNLPAREQGGKGAVSRAGRRAGSGRKGEGMTAALGRSWDGAGLRCGVGLGLTGRSGAKGAWKCLWSSLP